MVYCYDRLSPTKPGGCSDDYDCVHGENNDCVIIDQKYSNCHYCDKDSRKCIPGDLN